jgi:putative tricarboxylic transport membrane protein
MEGLSLFFTELVKLITFTNILLFIGSSLLGIAIGALPGLTATMGVALLTSITYGMSIDKAIIILLGLYVGAIYGGSVTAVLIGIPGTGSAAATVLDGHPLAKKGEGGIALSLATVASVIGTVFGIILLAIATPFLQSIALQFTSGEYFLLALFGVMICGSLSCSGEVLKGWIGGILGLIISLIGIDNLSGFSRYTFGNTNLLTGVNFLPAMIGLFGVHNILLALQKTKQDKPVAECNFKQKGISIFKMLRKYIVCILRSGAIGTFVGAIPGVGEDIAAWVSYDVAKKSSKESDKFGTGVYEGVVAPETANNAAIGGAMIPLLTLAVPGSAGTAILMGAFQLHGVRPGPMLATENPTFLYFICATLLLATVFMRINGLFACRFAPFILRVPVNILMPAVFVLSCIGSYAIMISKFDIYVMLIFGLLGYACVKFNIPVAPIVLGIILGRMGEDNLRRTMKANQGSVKILFQRPICIVLLILILITILLQAGFFRKIRMLIRKKRGCANT